MPGAENPLIGTWKLVRLETENQNLPDRQEPFGSSPAGYLLLTDNGRMMTLITAGNRKAGSTDEEQLALYRSMLAYTGKYEIAGDKFITKVDASWNQAWNGSEQVRFFKINTDRLELVSAWFSNPERPDAPMLRVVASWERAL